MRAWEHKAAEPLVSIITPAYNVAPFIETTIRSVLSQSFTSFEHLITDDCSSDDTAAVVARLSAQDDRIRLLRNPRNSGAAAARNTSLAHARGRYIAFLDGDDLWEPTKLEEQLRFMQLCGAPITFTAYRRIDERGDPLGRPAIVPELVDYRRLLRDSAIPTSSSMIDRTMVPPFEMKRTYYDDFALWLELLSKGAYARGLAQPLMIYRVRENSLSRRRFRALRHVWNTYREAHGIGRLRTAYYFAHYLYNGVKKYQQQDMI